MTSDKLNKTKAALVYDFDGTLAEGNCADHGLLPEIGITDIDDFWRKITKETQDRDADGILTYLGGLALQARVAKKREHLSPDKLKMHGSTIPLFPGVSKWFDRINSRSIRNAATIRRLVYFLQQTSR